MDLTKEEEMRATVAATAILVIDLQPVFLEVVEEGEARGEDDRVRIDGFAISWSGLGCVLLAY